VLEKIAMPSRKRFDAVPQRVRCYSKCLKQSSVSACFVYDYCYGVYQEDDSTKSRTDQVMNSGDKLIIHKDNMTAKDIAISVFSSPCWSKNKSVVTNVSDEGFTIIIDGITYFASFDKFPWFKNASAEHVFYVLGNPKHMCWPELDVDLREDDFKELAVVK